MISITFGLGGSAGEGGFFPEAEFALILTEEEISVEILNEEISVLVEEEIIIMEIME